VDGCEARTLLSSTVTALVASVAAPDYGQTVSFTATVTPKGKPTAVPTGMVQLLVDGDPYGPAVVLTNGQATLTETTLSAGRHRITAAYQPADATFRASDSSPLKIKVSPDATATSVSSSANPASYGQATSWTATVANASASGSGTPSGWVQFWVDGGRLGAPVALAGGQASLTDADLSAGRHTITASYTPADDNFRASTSPGLGETITPDPTTTSIALTALDVSSSGASVSFTATVVNASQAGSGLPTGAVQFAVDGGAVGLPVALVGGLGHFVDAAWPAGAHTVTAVYTSLDGNFQGSLGSIGRGPMAGQAAAYLAGRGWAPAQIAGDLKDVLGQDGASVASILDGLGDTAAQIAGALSVVYSDPDAVATGILKGLGFGGSEIAGALESVYGDPAPATAQLLQGAGYPVDAVALALEVVYQEDGTGVGETLDAAGFTPASIAEAMKDVFGWAPNQIAGLFEFDLGLPESTITAALDAVGFDWVFHADGSATSTWTTRSPVGTSIVTVVQYDASLVVMGTTVTVYDSGGSPADRETYDAAGQLVTTTEWDYEGAGRLTSETIVDAAGRMIEADFWYYNTDGSLFYSTRTDYDSAGRAVLEETSDGAGRPTVVVQRIYGASGTPIEITRDSSVYSAGGVLTQATEDTWLYNTSGTLRVVTEEDRSYNTQELEVKAIEYEWDFTDQGYLAGGLEIQDSFDARGNLTGYTVAEFNAAGLFTGWTSYDAQGNVITSGGGQPKGSWDLPNGKLV
jgi:YD repeat-containing protein